MKIDRLLGMTVYLLNRGVVPAKLLAERFGVSVRTIARDAEALSLAGIPIASSTGASGGYQILDTFKLNKQIVTSDDYLSVITALKGMLSAYDSEKVGATLEKLLASGQYGGAEQRVFIDFGVTGEGGRIPGYVREIESAIRENVMIEFGYTDAAGNASRRTVEPLALNYRWYAWYLLTFCTAKNDYRFFKLNRITNLSVTERPIAREHGSIPDLLERQLNSDTRRCFQMKLLCKGSARVQIMEYLKGRIAEELENGDFVMEYDGLENERTWLGLLMSFGGAVKVLEPLEAADMVRGKAAEICGMYM